MAYLDDDQEIETVPIPPSSPITTTATATITVKRARDSSFIKSLFAMAVFLSLALSSKPNPSDTLASDPACAPTDAIAVDMVFLQFFSLTFFMFSAITAFAHRNTRHVNTLPRFRLALGLVSDIGFLLGVVFLLFAIVDLAKMKLGTVSCGSSYDTLVAVVPLFIFTPLSPIPCGHESMVAGCIKGAIFMGLF